MEVRLTDVNDNPPMFRRPHVHVTVSEDTAPGALLASLPATDPDEVRFKRGEVFHTSKIRTKVPNVTK